MLAISVFLDSNILFEDYFFQKFHNAKLLDYCKRGLISIFMSEIVRLELRKQFLDELDEKNRSLNKLIKDFRRLRIEREIDPFIVEDELNKFDNFYNRLAAVDNFNVLPFKNDYLPDLVDRAIYRRKPFTKEKNELKDALIWKTYSDFVESMPTKTAVLLTENHSDFCDKKDHSRVHPDLVIDTDRFQVVKNSFEFIKKYAAILESPQHRLQVFLQERVIDDDYVNELVHEYLEDLLSEKIREKVQGLRPSDIIDDDEFWRDGYVSDGEIEILNSKLLEYEPLTDTVLISGKVTANCDVEVFEYNSARDPGEDQFNSIAETTIELDIYFSFNLSPDETVSDFEVINLEIADS
jgi:hypothetical protein